MYDLSVNRNVSISSVVCGLPTAVGLDAARFCEILLRVNGSDRGESELARGKRSPGSPPLQPERSGRASWAPMREEVVNMATLMKALRAVGYDRWLSFEDFSTAQPQAARVADNLAFMKAVEAETAL